MSFGPQNPPKYPTMTITPVTAPPGGGKEEGGRDRWTPEPYWLAILAKSMSFIFNEVSGLSEGTLYVCAGLVERISMLGIIMIRMHFINSYMNEFAKDKLNESF